VSTLLTDFPQEKKNISITISIIPATIYVKVIVPAKEEVRNKLGELFDFCHFEGVLTTEKSKVILLDFSLRSK